MMATLSVLLIICEGNPPVTGHQTKNLNNPRDLLFSLLLAVDK